MVRSAGQYPCLRGIFKIQVYFASFHMRANAIEREMWWTLLLMSVKVGRFNEKKMHVLWNGTVYLRWSSNACLQQPRKWCMFAVSQNVDKDQAKDYVISFVWRNLVSFVRFNRNSMCCLLLLRLSTVTIIRVWVVCGLRCLNNESEFPWRSSVWNLSLSSQQAKSVC